MAAVPVLHLTLSLALLQAFSQCFCSAFTDTVRCSPAGTNALSQVAYRPSSASGVVFPSPSSNPKQRPGTLTRYRCDPGYILVGDSARECLADGRWSGEAPHCYLNVAEASDLVLRHKALVDDNKTTYEDFQTLFGDGKTSLTIDLYFLLTLLELRFITDKELRGRSFTIKISSGTKALEFKTDAPQPRHMVPLQNDDKLSVDIRWTGRVHRDPGPYQESGRFGAGATGGRRWTHAKQPRRRPRRGPSEYVVPLLRSPSERGSRFVEVRLDASADPQSDPSSVRLLELQIVANSTGLSWRRCLDDLGRPTRQTWTDMTRCYHLFNESLTAKEAEDACHAISSDGTLFQPDDSGLLNMTVGLLSSLPAPAPTGLDGYVWVAGDRNAADGTTSECREFVRQTGRITPAHDCGARNWYICQRPPRLCGSPAQQASLIYSKPMVAAEGAVINVTCDDSPRTNGQIRCNAPKWSRPTFCDSKMEAMVEQNELDERGEAMPKMTIRRNELDEREDPMPRMTNYLGAVLGGVIGGTALLVLLGSAMFCTGRRRRGEARRKRRNGAAGVQTNNMELVLLNENPTYMPITDSVYSEIDDGEAIYEEPSFSAEHHTTRHSPEPPPLPASPPGCSVSDADGTLAPPIADEPEYEVFPDDDQPIKLPNHATDVNLITDRALSPTELIGAEQTMPGYAIPLVDGCMPAGSEGNLSFDSQPTGGGTAAMMAARDDDYAEPFDVEGYQGEGRRSAANTAGAATSKNGQDPDHGHDEH